MTQRRRRVRPEDGSARRAVGGTGPPERGTSAGPDPPIPTSPVPARAAEVSTSSTSGGRLPASGEEAAQRLTSPPTLTSDDAARATREAGGRVRPAGGGWDWPPGARNERRGGS